MIIEWANQLLRDRFNLWIVQDAQGWHEIMSLDYFGTWEEAFTYAWEYGTALESGIKGIHYE